MLLCVPFQSQNQMPYMTFVNSMSLEDKPGDLITEELELPCPNVPCERFLTHMNLSHDASIAHKVCFSD